MLEISEFSINKYAFKGNIWGATCEILEDNMYICCGFDASKHKYLECIQIVNTKTRELETTI